MENKKIVILNSTWLPYPNEGSYVVVVRKSSLKEFEEIKSIAESFIGHEATAKSLGIKYNRQPCRDFDIAFVARLKKRLAEGEVLEKITEQDIEIMKMVKV